MRWPHDGMDCFITATRDRVVVQAQPGDVLLNVAQIADMPLEGICEGQMACSTCHVIIAPEWFGKLPRASEDEDDMLDLAADVARTSRLIGNGTAERARISRFFSQGCMVGARWGGGRERTIAESFARGQLHVVAAG